MDLKLKPSSTPFFLFDCKMERGHEEVLTSQAGHRKGSPRETPIVSSLIVNMSIEELRLCSQIPVEISRETSDGATTLTFREAYNVVYFTREQFDAGLRLPVPSQVKQFQYFTRAPPALLLLKHFSDFDGLQRVELSLPPGHLVGGDMLYLHFEAWDWGPPAHVNPQSLDTIFNLAPRLP